MLARPENAYQIDRLANLTSC
uniref:Uncharacterized protein n=1 Tax=Anguilla anguilla TaxID=7936 RepID=A0A0E9XAX4_ANGAN